MKFFEFRSSFKSEIFQKGNPCMLPWDILG